MTPDQIIYHRRVRVMEHARRTSVSEACRMFGVSRTTFYRWQHRVEAGGVEALMPKGRRPPAMPNQTPAWVVDELLAEAVVRPTLGARRYARCARPAGFVISASGVQKILGRHGLGRRRQRVGGARAADRRDDRPGHRDAREGPFGFCHFAARPGDLVALTASTSATSKGSGRSGSSLRSIPRPDGRSAKCSSDPRTPRSRNGSSTGCAANSVASAFGSPACSPTTAPSSAARSMPISRTSRSPITGPHPAPPTTTRYVNGSRAPPCRNAGDPRSTGGASIASGNSAPRSTPGSSTTTPADRITATSCAAEPPAKSSTPPQEASIMTTTNRVHLSPRPVARKD